VADWLEDFTTLLDDLGVSVDDIRRGPLTDELDAPDETALIDYEGAPPDMGYCGPVTRLPRVAVQVRRATRAAAKARVEEIYVAIAAVPGNTSVGSTVFEEIIPQGEPHWLDEDLNGRTIYGASFEVRCAA